MFLISDYVVVIRDLSDFFNWLHLHKHINLSLKFQNRIKAMTRTHWLLATIASKTRKVELLHS